ncbi:hypothetical protein EDC96DRAFT_512538 [Choanephora cucurbitarum]|nr:hypothetical protein EDC96DRAFT_512538 [Choanephora cucurbitarum]
MIKSGCLSSSTLFFLQFMVILYQKTLQLRNQVYTSFKTDIRFIYDYKEIRIRHWCKLLIRDKIILGKLISCPVWTIQLYHKDLISGQSE